MSIAITAACQCVALDDLPAWRGRRRTECAGGSGWRSKGCVDDPRVARRAGLAPLAIAEPAPADDARVRMAHGVGAGP